MKFSKSLRASSPALMLATVSTAAMLSTPALAQEANTAGDIEELVVWGTRVKASSLNLGEQEIAIKQADHLSDLLRPIPGVDIGGTHSVNTRINFRGLDDRELNVYIDGALQTNYLYHHIGNLLINPDVLRSADIQLGTNTVTHGGLGGAVRFETKDAKELLEGSNNDIGLRASGTYHSNEQIGISATGYGQISEKIDFIGYFNSVDRENFKDGSDRSVIGNDGTTKNILLKVGVDIAENQRLEASYDKLSDKGDYTQRPDMGVLTNSAITGDILLPTEFSRESINLSYELDLGDALQLDATYYTNDMRLWRDETNPNIPRSLGSTREATSDNQGVNILALSKLETGSVTHTFKYGVEYFDQSLDYVQGTDAAINQNAQSLAIFIEDEISLDDRFILRPGVRYNDYKLEYKDTGESASWDDFTFGVAGEAVLTDGLRLLASYTGLFRGPELAEVFTGGGGYTLVNPDLEPETGRNIEFGFRFNTDFDGLAFNLGANYFNMHINNFISEERVPGIEAYTVWDVNSGTAKFEGFEASANLNDGNWDALVTFSHSSIDDSDVTAELGQSVRHIGDTLGAELSYTFDDIDLVVGWNMQHVFEKTAAIIYGRGGYTDGIKPSYTVHNISARWDNVLDSKGLTLIFGIDNLFDKTYTSHASRQGVTQHPFFGELFLNDIEPGRNIKVTIAKAF